MSEHGDSTWSRDKRDAILSRVAAERDARSALNDTLIGIINDLTAERDALQALVNEAAALLRSCPFDSEERFMSDPEEDWCIAVDRLLARLDAAVKADR